MTPQTAAVPVPGGELAAFVQEVGSDGAPRRDVILVHGVAYTCDVWLDLVREMSGRETPVRLVAFDLRGHGQSTAESATSDDVWRDIPRVAAHFGMERPVLVGHDLGGHFAAAAAAMEPSSAGALLIVEGSMAYTREQAGEWLAAVASPAMIDLIGNRFRLGETGPDAQSRDAFLDHLVPSVGHDWLTNETGVAHARSGLARSVFVHPDGSWIRKPTRAELMTLSAVADDSPVYPDLDLYARIACPLWFVQADDGMHQDETTALESLTDGRDDRQLRFVEGGHHVEQTDPGAVADVLEELLSTL